MEDQVLTNKMEEMDDELARQKRDLKDETYQDPVFDNLNNEQTWHVEEEGVPTTVATLVDDGVPTPQTVHNPEVNQNIEDPVPEELPGKLTTEFFSFLC